MVTETENIADPATKPEINPAFHEPGKPRGMNAVEDFSGLCESFAVDGSLITFMPGLTKERQSDVLDSILLARLSASRKFNQQAEPSSWYREFSRILASIGWTRISINTSTFTLDIKNISIESMVDLMFKDSEQEVTRKTVDLLIQQALSHRFQGKKRNLAFSSPSDTHGNWTLQLAVANSIDSAPALNLGYAFWKIEETCADYLSFRFFTASAGINMNNTQMLLNEEVYGLLREEIRKKLGKAVHDDITLLTNS